MFGHDPCPPIALSQHSPRLMQPCKLLRSGQGLLCGASIGSAPAKVETVYMVVETQDDVRRLVSTALQPDDQPLDVVRMLPESEPDSRLEVFAKLLSLVATLTAIGAIVVVVLQALHMLG